MCRWPNGDVSFVSARTKADAVVMVDELDNAELAEVRQIRDFMVDFRLNDTGDLQLEAFGEECLETIWQHAYPILARAREDAPVDEAGEPTAEGEAMIRLAVQQERNRRIRPTAQPKAETEIGRQVQEQLGASATLVNRQVKAIVSKVLDAIPIIGRKQ